MAQISLVIYLVTGAALSMGYFELLYIMLALVSRVRRVVRAALLELKVPQPFWGETEAALASGLVNQPADAF